jgi:hypothetical protein
MRLIERGTLSDEGRDILSILLRANKGEAEHDRLTTQQVIDNVSVYLLYLYYCAYDR